MSSSKGRLIGGDKHEEKVYGPSWYDVWVIIRELKALTDDDIKIVLTAAKTVNGRASLCAEVHRNGAFMFYCGKRFLETSPEASKTAAAAFWAAATRAYHIIEEENAVKNGEYPQLDITSGEADDPFSPSEQDE